MSPTTRILRTTVLAVALVVTPAMASAAPAPATTNSCSTVWGSLPKYAAPVGEQGLQFLLNVRSGQHPCYDRVVFDLTGNDSGPVGYSVEYVDAVANEATGEVVPLAGGARLRVVIAQGSFDYGSQSSAYIPPDTTRLVDVAGYRTLRQVEWADTFNEADSTTTMGIGVRARLPMRAFLLPSASQFFGQRLVVDIAHHW
jgi:hypothetical protein